MYTKNVNVTPSFCVESLTDRNAGKNHIIWIDVDDPQDPEDIIAQFLEASPTTAETGEVAEEWEIVDWQGYYGLRAYDLEEVVLIGQLIDEHGEAYAVHVQVSGDAEEREFLNSYKGYFDSEEQFAMRLLDSTGAIDEVPNWLLAHIDYESYAQDLFMSGDYSFIDGYVFSN